MPDITMKRERTAYASRIVLPPSLQGSPPAGWLSLCREGVEPSGSLQKVSDHPSSFSGLSLAQGKFHVEPPSPSSSHHSITSSARVSSALSPFQPKMERITPPTKLLMCQFVSAVQTSAEECPGQQSPQPPAARMEAPPSLESPPEPIPATGAIADPAP